MKSGIYKITNIITNDIYIGSSINLDNRKRTHFNQLNKNIHNNNYLQNAFNKYNKENFIFDIIINCNKDSLLLLEQKYIDELQPKYNILQIAGNSLGYKHSNNSITKLKSQNKDYCSKKVYQYDLNNNLIKEWNSCSEYAKYYNISRIAVIKAIKRNHKCKGFIVSYTNSTL